LVLGNKLDKQANNQEAIDSLQVSIEQEFGSENIMFGSVSILCDFGVQEAIEKFGEQLVIRTQYFLEPAASFSKGNNRFSSMVSSGSGVPYDF